jgi:short-subunit dehydrogenase
MNKKKSNVLITGASAGAGRAIAVKFASEGFNIIAVARRKDKLDSLKNELQSKYGTDVFIMTTDLENEEAVYELYDKAKEIGIDVLINNAGLGEWNLAWETSLERLNAMINLNIRALSILATCFVKDNVSRKATLINIASLAGYSLFSTAVPYSATKYFVTSFTEGLTHDLKLANSPLQAKLMAPGPIDTEFTKISLEQSKLGDIDTSDVQFHTPQQIATFTYQLYESDKPIGMVDMASMGFILTDTIHSSASIK